MTEYGLLVLTQFKGRQELWFSPAQKFNSTVDGFHMNRAKHWFKYIKKYIYFIAICPNDGGNMLYFGQTEK